MKKRFPALLWTLLFCLLLTLSSFAEDAPQVSDSDLLARARALGILDGFSDESPEKPITRREFCALTDNLLTSLGMTTGNPMRAPFEDTFDPAVMGLYVAGIVKGTSETTFSPDDTLIRADAACLTARTAAFCHVGLPEKAVTVPTEEIPDYAQHNVGLVMAYGLFVGTGNGFEPYEPYTVEQSATVLVRLYDLVKAARSEAFEDKLLSLLPKDKNFMVSPLSLKAALALAANGASDNTLDEILNTLGYPDLVSFNEAMKKALKAKSRETLVFETANSLWLNRDNMTFSFRKEYTGAMSNLFGATASETDSKNAVREINAWASEKTHGKIEKIISDSNFAALLANAVYFKGSWYSSFYERNTKNEIFTDANGQKKEIPFLEDGWRLAGYSENDACKLVKIGYHTGASERQVSMVIVLPNEGVALNSIRLSEQIQNADWKNEHVSIKLPKFHIESSFDLTDSLKSLGIKKAFDKDKADFSPMFGAKFAYLDTILQNTYIHVDENGTEAAAVTSSGSGGSGPAPFKPIPFVADHPFYFAIVDEINNEMLFAGQFAYAA